MHGDKVKQEQFTESIHHVLHQRSQKDYIGQAFNRLHKCKKSKTLMFQKVSIRIS